MRRQKTETRQNVLAAALETFAEKGYDGATIREIATRAGITEMTLLRHFGTKDALLREALHDQAPVPPAQVRELPSDLDQAVALVSRQMWDGMMGPRRRLMKVLIGESVRRPEFGEPLSYVPREVSRRLGAYLQAQQEAGTVRQGDPRLQALALLGMFFAVAVGGDYSTEEGHSPEQIVNTFAEIFLRGVKKG